MMKIFIVCLMSILLVSCWENSTQREGEVSINNEILEDLQELEGEKAMSEDINDIEVEETRLGNNEDSGETNDNRVANDNEASVEVSDNAELTDRENIDTITDSAEGEENLAEDSQAIYELTADEAEWTVDSVGEDQFTNWRWDYYSDDKKYLWIVGPWDDGAIDFELYYPDESLCSWFAATAYLEKSWVANYYDDSGDCQINLTYNPGIIEVNTYECSVYEDIRCGSFSWVYKK